MPGEHGSLWAYISAYHEYGGTPPIPDDAPISRGDERPRWQWITATVVSLMAGLGPVYAIMQAVVLAPAPAVTTVTLGSVALCWIAVAAWVGQVFVNPTLDWLGDVPRRFPEGVDA